MPFYTIEAQIAPGHNNAAGLALVTSLSVSSIPFVEVFTAGQYTRGEPRIKATGAPARTGFPAKEWTSGLLWLPQWEYLVANYEGAVTIRTWTGGTSYANYNAYLSIDDQSEYETANEVEYGHALVNFIWRFTKLVAI